MRMRTQESKEQILEIVRMRIDGYTFQQIADKYGVTKQCIHQKISAISGQTKTRQIYIDEKVIYPNLAKWMYEERISKIVLSGIIGLSTIRTKSISDRLYGKIDFGVSEAKKLLEITGQTFEYLFSTEKAD